MSVMRVSARRWSIEHGVTDPQQAWEGYNRDRAAHAAHTGTAPTRGRFRFMPRHAHAATVPVRSSGWVDVPDGATTLRLMPPAPATVERDQRHAGTAEPAVTVTAAPAPLSGVPDDPTVLPEVPSPEVRDTLTPQALREHAQRTYRLARESGTRLTGAQLGEAYGRGERWGRAQIEAVERNGAASEPRPQNGGAR
jgi:hypothetical protein